MPVRPRPGPGHAAPPHRPRRSRRPDQLVHRPNAASAWSPARSAPAKPSPSAPPSPAWTPPGTPSSTCPTPRSASAASTTPSSPPSAANPWSTSPPRPPGRRRAGRRTRRTRPHPRPRHRRSPPARPRPTRNVRMLTNHDMDSRCPFAFSPLRAPPKPTRTARHNPYSIASLRHRIARMIMRKLDRCPYCNHPTELPKWRTTGLFIKCYDTVHQIADGKEFGKMICCRLGTCNISPIHCRAFPFHVPWRQFG